MISLDKPWVLYGLCSVLYEGRATSVVGPGYRLIFHKQDGSLIIHGALKTTQLNYNRAGARLEQCGNILISSTDTEKISITLDKIEYYHELEGWSEASVKMSGTESQLCKHIIDNAGFYFGVPIIETHTEYQTEVGPIDLVFKSDDLYHCVEVKRKKASMLAVYQLHRYMEVLSKKLICKGYLIAPDISGKALDKLNSLGYKFIKVSKW